MIEGPHARRTLRSVVEPPPPRGRDDLPSADSFRWASYLGYLALLAVAAWIGSKEGLALTEADLVFLETLGLLALIRVLDATVLGGILRTSGHDRPPSLREAGRHIVVETLGAGALWLLAHGVAVLTG